METMHEVEDNLHPSTLCNASNDISDSLTLEFAECSIKSKDSCKVRIVEQTLEGFGLFR